jgi:hypothetical protein
VGANNDFPLRSPKTIRSMTINPYQSPQTDFTSSEANYAPTYSVRLASKNLAYRRLCVCGPTPAIIEYDGLCLGYERVLVNRVVVAKASNWGLPYTPRIDFQIAAENGPISARIEVKTAWLFFLGGFRLQIAGVTVYTEGKWDE